MDKVLRTVLFDGPDCLEVNGSLEDAGFVHGDQVVIIPEEEYDRTKRFLDTVAMVAECDPIITTRDHLNRLQAAHDAIVRWCEASENDCDASDELSELWDVYRYAQRLKRAKEANADV